MQHAISFYRYRFGDRVVAVDLCIESPTVHVLLKVVPAAATQVARLRSALVNVGVSRREYTMRPHVRPSGAVE